MLIRLRQLRDKLSNGLTTIPLVYAVLAVFFAFGLLNIDAQLGADYWPSPLETTSADAKSLLTTVASGLITGVTLLLSLTLVAVQLGSSQFSPRTISNWLGDRTIQRSIGFVLGTIVFSLISLQASGSVEGRLLTVPHRAAVLALLFTVLSLLAVVRSVDHLAQSLRVGSVAQNILAETLALIRSETRVPNRPAVPLTETPLTDDVTGEPAVAPIAGWVQQVDRERLLEICPPGATITVVKPVGTFALNGSPLAVVDTSDADDEIREGVAECFALGTTRTMQEDTAYGLVRLSDIAMRALSPGINDPNTAIDVLNYIATILLALFEIDDGARPVTDADRTVVVPGHTHLDYVKMAIDPVRRTAHGSAAVLVSIARLAEQILHEIQRRSLPVNTSVFDSVLADLRAAVKQGELLPSDADWVQEAVTTAESVRPQD